ncbi:hypothetical protein RvY_08207-2 [Ramazzottius varieornatus]|uniref:Intraflagellar transport protein 46 homolog n=1 Tax=Ramazzottius varieornatus TaxID=947166 RepID=A0A1D1VAR3_RAMVA|nr:hypothetical protein RvY_08207-2 [Ramazzottius varieornatus]
MQIFHQFRSGLLRMALRGSGGMSLRERELLRGNQAPSPESQRRQKLSEEAALTSSEEEDVSPTFESHHRLSGSKPAMFADEEDEFGFMESKPIVARGQQPKSSAGGNPTRTPSAEQLNEEEPKYYRDNRRPSKGPLRPLRGTADDPPQNDELRKHFLRRPSERGPSARSTAEPLLGTSHHNVRDRDDVASPNLPGVNEKIEAFLEGLKKTKNRPKSVVLSKPRRKPEVLMQAWPADMERLLAVPDAFSKLDCTLEEYIDITCALVGIPVYDDRFEALHQLFTLYVDLKELAR